MRTDCKFSTLDHLWVLVYQEFFLNYTCHLSLHHLQVTGFRVRCQKLHRGSRYQKEVEDWVKTLRNPLWTQRNRKQGLRWRIRRSTKIFTWISWLATKFDREFGQNYIKFTLGIMDYCRVHPTSRAGGKRVCGGFRSEYAKGQTRDDLFCSSWRTMGSFEESYDGDDGQRRGANKWQRRGANQKRTIGHVRGLDLFVTVILLQETPAVLFLIGKTLWGSWGYLPLDQRSKTTSDQEMAREHDCNTSNNVAFLLSLVCQRVPSFNCSLLHHLHRKIPWWCQQIHRKSSIRKKCKLRMRGLRWDPSRGSSRNRKTQIMDESTKKYEENFSRDLPDWLHEFREWLMKVLPTEPWGNPEQGQSRRLPILFTNFLWSREQKWNQVRVSTAFVLTSRMTQIVISAWRTKITRASWSAGYSRAQSGTFLVT